jgi:hypothetical protein
MSWEPLVKISFYYCSNLALTLSAHTAKRSETPKVINPKQIRSPPTQGDRYSPGLRSVYEKFITLCLDRPDCSVCMPLQRMARGILTTGDLTRQLGEFGRQSPAFRGARRCIVCTWSASTAQNISGCTSQPSPRKAGVEFQGGLSISHSDMYRCAAISTSRSESECPAPEHLLLT